MKGILYAIALAGALAVTGCASVHRSEPIIDPAGVDMGLYQQDLVECQQIAKQVEDKTGTGALGGALVGALFGAVIGDSDTVRKSAAAGAVAGGAEGAVETDREKGKVVKNCLRNRGYTVLN